MSAKDWSFLEARLDEVQRASADEASQIVGEGLRAIDSRLGVEITDSGGERTVVITAGGDADAFARVRELVEGAPSIAGWSFVALRPALGFDVEVHVGSMVFFAKSLSFQPLPPDESGALGVRLLVPNPQLEQWAQIGPQIIEAGLGEAIAARIGTIEIGKREDDSENVYALESLPGYIERHA